jgi:hypothetical protein
MTDGRGTYEHALFTEPRPEHGFCTDDMARILMVASREPEPSREVCDLAEISLRFLQLAQDGRGKFRNRMNRLGRWEDRPSTDDCWGRSIWGLGTAVSRSSEAAIRQLATCEFDRATTRRSPWSRAMAFAALGAAEVLVAKPDNASARRLLSDAAEMLGRTDPASTARWIWPERRLTYANAALPEAMIAAGDLLNRPGLVERGLELLEWLLDRETLGDHLSVTPVGGAGPGDRRPSFDQQPIEVASLADACARAAAFDGNPRWTAGVAAAAAWFLGDNDGRTVMWDPITGGGFDGLEPDRANLNEGTESTLALLSTLQHARHLVRVPVPR